MGFITANVLQIAEGGEFKVVMSNMAQIIIRSTTFQLTDTPPLLAMCCYKLYYFFLSVGK